MKVAIEGCLHGELEAVYSKLTTLQEKIGIKLDLLLICGDFQSLRHEQDLRDMHCPEKYKVMGHFHEYFEREKVAPILTVLIGGNHEAVNSLRESHFGGWLAPNIYFLGQAGSIFIRKGTASLRISGCSGIYNAGDFKYCTKIERYPLMGKDRITAYHTKQVDLFRLELLARINQMIKEQPEQYGDGYANFDIFLSHDWPKDIALYGSMQELMTYKPFLKKEIDSRTFGSAPLLRILEVAKPNYWFSAHMHVKYAALYPHAQERYTHFLSLDKCLLKRSCLQVLEFKKPEEAVPDEKEEVKIEVDPVWVGVLLLTEELMQGIDQLYYNDKENVKLVNIEKMNSYIKAYPSLRQKISSIGKFSFNPQMTQEQQTEQFITTIGISKKSLEGICIRRQQVLQFQDEKDEIELDL